MDVYLCCVGLPPVGPVVSLSFATAYYHYAPPIPQSLPVGVAATQRYRINGFGGLGAMLSRTYRLIMLHGKRCECGHFFGFAAFCGSDGCFNWKAVPVSNHIYWARWTDWKWVYSTTKPSEMNRSIIVKPLNMREQHNPLTRHRQKIAPLRSNISFTLKIYLLLLWPPSGGKPLSPSPPKPLSDGPLHPFPLSLYVCSCPAARGTTWIDVSN